MNKLLFALLLFPILIKSQNNVIPTNKELSKIYSLAISDFIKAANKKNKHPFDTLYFGKRQNGQEDDFPNIELPKKIENTQIILISPALGAKKQKDFQSSIYINLMAWIQSETAEFIFVVFSNDFKHQYDYHIQYKFLSKLKKYELLKLEYKGPPFDK